MNPFATTSFVPLQLGGDILWVFFGIVVVVFSLMSLIYIYHWRTYGTGNRTLNLVEKLYLGVGFFLIVTSALLIALH